MEAVRKEEGKESPTVHLIGNAHIDPVWLWRWPEGFAEVKATFRSALDRMRETADYIFTSSSAAFFEWIEENDPEIFQEILERVRQGRWAIAGGWWIEPDCNLPGGEALVRQGLYGQRYFREKFGLTCKTGYCVDSFGHAATLPKILAGCGMQGYVFMRPQPHENDRIPLLAFRWRGDDGTEVAALRIPDAYTVWSAAALAGQLRRNLELAARTPLQTQTVAFYGVGNHGGGPTRQMLHQIAQWQAQEGMPALVHSSPDIFLALARSRRLPVWQGEMQHHARGCYAAVSAIKTANRKAEEALLRAELWGAAARALAGRKPPTAALARAWKQVLFNQFHDILAGSSVAEAYVDAQHQIGAALHAAESAANDARQAISWRIDIQGEGAPLVVFNNQPFSFTGVVETEDVGFLVQDPSQGEPGLTDNAGRPVPCQAIEPHTICGRRRFVAQVSLPPLGYAVLRQGAVPGNAARRLLGKSAVRAGKLALENDCLSLGLDRRGYLTLYDRRRRRPVLDRAGGVPLVIEDPSDTWSHGIDAFRQVAGRFKKVGAEVLETGPVRGCLSVRYAWRDSLLILEYLLGAGEPFVAVRGRIDWREHWQALKLAFPVPSRAARWTAEVPYGTVERPTNGEEEPVQQWVDLSAGSGGLAVANDGRYSCSAEPGELRLTLLRSPAYAFHDPHRPASFARHEFTDQGVQTFRLALVPHGGDWREAGVVEIARQLNRGPDTLSETVHPGPLPAVGGFVSCRGKGVYIGALKEAEDGGGLIVRAAEWFGRRWQARFAIAALGRDWTATFKGREIKTFLVPDDPRQPVREVSMLEE
jgi:alpha-mannosidase